MKKIKLTKLENYYSSNLNLVKLVIIYATNRNVNCTTILVNNLEFKTLKAFLTIDLVISFQNLRVYCKHK